MITTSLRYRNVSPPRLISMFLLSAVVILSACDSSNSSPDNGFNGVGGVVDANAQGNDVSENALKGVEVGITASATIEQGATISYNLTDNANGRFVIDQTTGVITVGDDTQLDFETDTSHSITAQATSSNGASRSADFIIEVSDETFASGGDFENLIILEAGPDLEDRMLEALLTATPEAIIQLPQGTYDFTLKQSIGVNNIILRGHGMDAVTGTVLKFDNQTVGSESISVTGDNFIIEDMAIVNSPGDAIKISGTTGVIIRRVRIEWTNGPDTDNGAYGLYPVQTKNVLIEDNIVRGASDAGIYVGQSENIIVRRNYVYENVAGIEIENSKFADVYENETTANTGGILVFDLPGPPIQGGQATRVFNNNIYDNNTPNFARAGNVVGQVPAGTGIMIMANDDIEVFGNTISGNQSTGITIVSYYIVDAAVSKAAYDPVPEKIYIHDNILTNNSQDPLDTAAQISNGVFGGNMVDIFYDSSGVSLTLGLLLEFPDGLAEDQRICIANNGTETTIGRINALVVFGGLPFDPGFSVTKSDFDCSHASLPEIVLPPLSSSDQPDAGIDTAALCNASGSGINSEAFVADCPNLSDYRLFASVTDPTSNANGGIIYDLTSPLFTDYANKYRFVFVPEGASAAFRSDDAFDFPVGTIISKTFAIQSDLRDPGSTVELIETRLLIRRTSGWQALPYIWNSDKSEAVLTIAGGIQNISWIDVNGDSQATDYVIPNSFDCSNCHGEDGIEPIGPKARLLNKTYDHGNGLVNQLTHWSEQGILSGAPDDKSSIVTIPAITDTNATLDDKARGYLDVNCAHCHSETGAGRTSGLYLDYSRAFSEVTGRCKRPVAAGDGAGTLSFDIVPGDSDASILPFRMNSNENAVRMPELGRSIIHTEGVTLIQEWINAMPADDCGAP